MTTTGRLLCLAACGGALTTAAAARAARPPDLDLLASTLQPAGGANRAVYGAPSVTNAWGSVLASSGNVLGFNALEMAPFSSGWDARNLYGWTVDSASLSVDGANVEPNATLWTPYSVLRTGTAAAAAGGAALALSSELRFVFEAQALLLEVNVSLLAAAGAAAVALGVDLRAPVRYFARADNCSSWHYPTQSVPGCWNWFPPEAPSGEDGAAFFAPQWLGCGAGGGAQPLATMLSTDL